MLSENNATLNGHSPKTNYSESYAELSKTNFLAGESEAQKRETDQRLLTLLLHEVEKKGEFKHPKYVAYTKKKKENLHEVERQKAENSKDSRLTNSIANISNVNSSGVVFFTAIIASNPLLALVLAVTNFTLVKKINESMVTNRKGNKSWSNISFAALLLLSSIYTLMAGTATSAHFSKQVITESHANQLAIYPLSKNYKIAKKGVINTREQLQAFSNSVDKTYNSEFIYQLPKDISIPKEVATTLEQNNPTLIGSVNVSGQLLNNAVQQYEQVVNGVLEYQIQSLPNKFQLVQEQEEQLRNRRLEIGTSHPTALDYLRLNQPEIFDRNFITTSCSEEQNEDGANSPQCYEISSGLTAVNVAMSDLSGSLGTIPKALWQQDSDLLKQVLHQNFLQLCVMFIVGTISLVAVLKLRTHTLSKDVRNSSDEMIDVKSEAAS